MKTLNDAGILAIAPRMKRLYDILQKEMKDAYLLSGIDFEPRWFPIAFALSENMKMSIMELSHTTGIAHPNIIQLSKEMESVGWIESEKSATDKRVRTLYFTKKAEVELSHLKKVWSDMRRVIDLIIAEGQVDFWSGLLEFESSLIEKSFKERIMETQQKEGEKEKNVLHPGMWFDREFHFENLSTTSHGVLERLTYTPTRLKELVLNLTEEKLIQSSGKWSIKQNIGHLTDLEPIWIGRVNDILDGKEQMRGIDLTNKKTHEANHNYITTSDLINNFSSIRSQLVDLCRQNINKMDTISAIHPRLGIEMRIIDLMYFVAEHDDHHIATIHFLINQ